MKHRIILLGTAGLLGLALMGALTFFSTSTLAAPSASTVRYVAPGGNCGGATPCYASPQAAADAAAAGDEIRIAAGTYIGVSSRPDVTGEAPVTQTLYINKTMIIRGGYTTANWRTSNPTGNPTTLDAQGKGRVLYVAGEINPSIEGLHITGGNTGKLDLGGGAYVISATVVMSGNQVFGNTALGEGGGLYFDFADATLLSNRISDNKADGDGGGIYLFGGDKVTLTGNRVYNNTAGNDGGGACLAAIADVTLTGNQVNNNTAGNDGGGLQLSGIDVSLTLTGNSVYSNTAANDGGGIYLGGIVTAGLTGNQVYSNTCENDGGGINFSGVDSISLASNLVYGNASGNDGGGVQLGGADSATLTNNQVFDNSTGNNGGGLSLSGQKHDLEGNRIYHNEAGADGGGMHVVGSDGDLLKANRIYDNTAAGSGGGGFFQFAANTLLTDNLIYGNAAGADGGGIGLAVSENVTLINDALLDNRVTGSGDLGAGLYAASSSNLRFLHATLARNGGSSAIYLINNGLDRVTTALTNTLLSSHSVGINVTGTSLVKINGILWYDTPVTVSREPAATVTVQNQVQGNPAFAADGYHLTANSGAIDKGVAAGVASDIDGETRPRGGAPDLGADEYSPQAPSTSTPTPTPTRTPTHTATPSPTATATQVGALTATPTRTPGGRHIYLPLVLRRQVLVSVNIALCVARCDSPRGDLETGLTRHKE